jgi:hypothetical protein
MKISKKDFLYGIFILLFFPSYIIAQPLPPGRLIAHYPFNANANDVSGNEHNGIVNGATLTMDNLGELNSAYEFDNSDNIQIANHPDFDFVDFDFINRVTISAWFKPTNTNGAYLITKKADSNTPGPYSLGFSQGLPRVLLYNDVGDVLIDLLGTSSLEAGIWQHIGFTFNGNQVNLYYNGQLEVSQSASGSLQKSDGEVYIGYSAYDNQYYEGAIDDIYFNNYAMSHSEILDLYYANVVTGSLTRLPTNFTALSKDSEQNMDIKVYPNPIEGEVNIEFHILKDKSDFTLRIINQQGRILNTISMKALEKGLHNFQMERDEIMGGSTDSGFYVLTLELDELFLHKCILLK